MKSQSSVQMDAGSRPGGALGGVLVWAASRGLAPKPPGRRMPWDGSYMLGWLNWALVVVITLTAVLILWHIGWAVAGGGGAKSDLGSGIVGGDRDLIPAGRIDSSGVSQGSAGSVGGVDNAGESHQRGESGARSEGGPPAFPSYNSKLRQDLFGLGPEPQRAVARTAEGPQPNDLKLNGVILGDPPQAILYDSRRGTTHWVTVGERIGEITVEEIHENAVRISFRGESLDLKL